MLQVLPHFDVLCDPIIRELLILRRGRQRERDFLNTK